jgi:hypothetical protein
MSDEDHVLMSVSLAALLDSDFMESHQGPSAVIIVRLGLKFGQTAPWHVDAETWSDIHKAVKKRAELSQGPAETVDEDEKRQLFASIWKFLGLRVAMIEGSYARVDG